MIGNTTEESKKSYPLPSINEQITGCPKKKERNEILGKKKVLSWTPCIESLSCQASHSTPSFQEKLVQKVLSPASHSFDCFLPQAPTLFPPWQCLLLSGFIQNSITFKESSVREMGCSLLTLMGLWSWPQGMHFPLPFARKLFEQSTTKASLYYS